MCAVFSGPHPAGLVSTHISAIYPVDIQRSVWTIGYQEVISIGYLLKNKTLRTHKNIAIAGESVFKPSLLSSRIGANLDELTAGKIENNSRIISGSVLFGHDAKDAMSYLGFYDNQVSVISCLNNFDGTVFCKMNGQTKNFGLIFPLLSCFNFATRTHWHPPPYAVQK